MWSHLKGICLTESPWADMGSSVITTDHVDASYKYAYRNKVKAQLGESYLRLIRGLETLRAVML
jgi:hypothetical protein